MVDNNFLKENNASHMWHPMSHPADSLANRPTIIKSARGVRITDIDGHEVIDAVGGLWNINLGFSCQPIKDAISAQLDLLPYYSTFRGTTNDAAIELSYELRQFFEPDGCHVPSSHLVGRIVSKFPLDWPGNIIKIRGEIGRTKFLSLKKGYHGNIWVVHQ